MIIKILIVDNHLRFRQVLSSVLGGVSDIVIVGEASNGLEAVQKARELKPDVVLMDIRMPVMNGIEATAILKEEMPEVKVLILTLFGEDYDIFLAMKAGAQGYILKSADFDGIKTAIIGIAANNVIITPVKPSRLIPDSRRREKHRETEETGILSPREKQVLELVAKWATYQEIARKLSISEEEVKEDLRNILKKFQANFHRKTG